MSQIHCFNRFRPIHPAGGGQGRHHPQHAADWSGAVDGGRAGGGVASRRVGWCGLPCVYRGKPACAWVSLTTYTTRSSMLTGRACHDVSWIFGTTKSFIITYIGLRTEYEFESRSIMPVEWMSAAFLLPCILQVLAAKLGVLRLSSNEVRTLGNDVEEMRADARNLSNKYRLLIPWNSLYTEAQNIWKKRNPSFSPLFSLCFPPSVPSKITTRQKRGWNVVRRRQTREERVVRVRVRPSSVVKVKSSTHSSFMGLTDSMRRNKAAEHNNRSGSEIRDRINLERAANITARMDGLIHSTLCMYSHMERSPAFFHRPLKPQFHGTEVWVLLVVCRLPCSRICLHTS